MPSNVALGASDRSEVSSAFPLAEALLGASLFGASCISILLTRVPGGIALFWPSSAIAGAVLIRLHRVRWIAATLSVFFSIALSNIVAAHRPWQIACLFSGVNLVEVALMVAAFRFVWRHPYPNISIEHAALMTALFGIWVPGITACLGGLMLHLLFGTPWLTGMQHWWSSHTIGACLLGPPVILFSLKGLMRLTRSRFLAENLVTLAVGLVGLDLPVIAFLATVMPPIAVGLGSDARRAAARNLRLSERRFRESMAHSPIGMLIAELDGKWTYTNLALQKMLGYSDAEFRSMPPGGPSKTDDWKNSKPRLDRLLGVAADHSAATLRVQNGARLKMANSYWLASVRGARRAGCIGPPDPDTVRLVRRDPIPE